MIPKMGAILLRLQSLSNHKEGSLNKSTIAFPLRL